MFEPLEPRDIEPTIERFDSGGWPETRLRRIEHEQASARDLDEADVIVCVGAEVEDLPELPAGVALGGTREACEAGLLPRSRQIGLLGRQVAPRLLVAVDVRGDAEELTGFVKANVVAAIGVDRSAPMLAAADVAVVGDWREMLPSLLEAI
jgi:electron transfer flavoprotein alpha subunit